jgi:succinate dehydrogenase/fumarate reductase cytochrome b subunit
MRLRTFHAISATVIASYAAVHIANHLAALGGIATHIAFMEAARSVYRIRFVEAVLLACVLFQVLSGLWLVARGWRQRRGTVSWLQAVAGIYLAFFLVVHVSAVLFGRLSLGLDTNFYFAAAGFHVPPFQLFFVPYYLFGVLALFTHLGCAAYWRAKSSGRSSPSLFIALPVAVGVLLSLVIVLLLAGVFYRVEIPSEYRAIYVSRA